MIAEDKFGNPIYPSRFSKLKENEKVLLANGYIESKSKPNLFYKKMLEGMLFADMRGTEQVHIWEDTSPMFYWKLNSNIPNWKQRRILKTELNDLHSKGCSCRFSFLLHSSDCGPFESTSYSVQEDALEHGEEVFSWDDGYCRFCGKDFQKDGTFCSSECEEKYLDKYRPICNVCGQIIRSRAEDHHITYFPEKIITTCLSCHRKIHKTDQYPHLKPKSTESKKYYKYPDDDAKIMINFRRFLRHNAKVARDKIREDVALRREYDAHRKVLRKKQQKKYERRYIRPVL